MKLLIRQLCVQALIDRAVLDHSLLATEESGAIQESVIFHSQWGRAKGLAVSSGYRLIRAAPL
jgi:hypothetical protein